MKFKPFGLMAATAFVMAGLSPASATCWSNCGNESTATADAWSSGFAGTALNGWNKTKSKQTGGTLTNADAGGRAVASGWLSQETGGVGVAHESLQGELLMDGGTGAMAKLGRRGESANTETYGSATLMGTATGDVSVVGGSLHGESTQGSTAIDTDYGGASEGYAEQTTKSGVGGFAAGRDVSVTEVSTSSSSGASVSLGDRRRDN